MENFKQKIESEYIFPDNLSETDIFLVKKQCEIQSATSKEQIEGFAIAYSGAKKLAANEDKLNQLNSEDVEALILEWAVLIEKRNEKGYRKVPVTFQNGSKALDAEKIPQAIKGFCQGFESFLKDPTEDERLNTALLYTEFEKIHPLEDGNGRLGDILWKILETKKNGNWPEELPPNIFNEKRD